jgi:hypothetical protein
LHNRQCRRFIVNHCVRFFSDIPRCKHWLFFNFSDIFLISPTSDPSAFLLNRAVLQQKVCKLHVHVCDHFSFFNQVLIFAFVLIYYVKKTMPVQTFSIMWSLPFISVNRLFLNFSDIFLISPTSDPSAFLLNRAVLQQNIVISLRAIVRYIYLG